MLTIVKSKNLINMSVLGWSFMNPLSSSVFFWKSLCYTLSGSLTEHGIFHTGHSFDLKKVLHKNISEERGIYVKWNQRTPTISKLK